MFKSLTIGSSPVATVDLNLISVEAAQATFTLNVRHTSPATHDITSDLFDEAGAFGEDPGGPARLRLTLNFSDGQSVDNVSSLQRQAPTSGGSEHSSPSASDLPLLAGGEGGSYMTDDDPTRTAERTFRLQPLPAGKLVSIDFRWPGLQIPDTRTGWT